MTPKVLKALLLTSIAGLSTTIGSLLGLVFKRENSRFMSFVLGFTAGDYSKRVWQKSIWI